MKEKDHSRSGLDKTRKHIDQFGLSVVMIQSTSYLPSFAYSIGLKETQNHPEIICFGLSVQSLHVIINDVAEIIKTEGSINPDKEYDNIFQGSRAKFLRVDKKNLGDYFGATIEYYGSKDFEALQLVWTDRNGKFPWEPHFEEELKHFQPLLDRNTDFKFREAEDLGVYTTHLFIEANEPILRVVHEEDGDWQFLTRQVEIKDAVQIALKEIVLIDPTLNEVFNLDYGEAAEREYLGARWKRTKVQYS